MRRTVQPAALAALTTLSSLLLAAAQPAGAQQAPAQQAAAASVSDLPLIELPAGSTRPFLAVFLTGDGGWADLDRLVSARLTAAGVPVVGWNSLKYYWVQRSPEQAAADLERILACYLARWQKREVVLIGYSRGADVLPFLANRLPPRRLKQVRLLALLGPATANRFEPLAAGYIHLGPQPPALPLAPEVEKLRGLRILGFYGAEETDSLCLGAAGLLQCVRLAGGHHFGGAYARIAERILAEL
jgi:type IV secretory pathway VirJ component